VTGRRGRAIGTGVVLGLCLLTCGCGDRFLWERYRAERTFWRLGRTLERIERDPAGTSPESFARVSARLASLAARYPAAEWAPRASHAGYGRDVALLAGRANLMIARLEELSGRKAQAAGSYERLLAAWKTVPEVALGAAVGRARALEASGQGLPAAEALMRVARDEPIADAGTGAPIAAVLEAPARGARLLREAGRGAEADSLLDAEAAEVAAEVRRAHGRPAAADFAVALADLRTARGQVDPALAALRTALGEPLSGPRRGSIILLLARRSLDGGHADTALIYARWAARELPAPERSRAVMMMSEVWEAADQVDSALAGYEHYLEVAPAVSDSGALARFRRAELLERLGRWDQARTEFHGLAASQPTHPLGFESLLRVVRHHAARGEGELARIEGDRAIESLDRIIAMHFDVRVRAEAGFTRGEVQATTGDLRSACATFQDVWKHAPTTPAAVAAGFRAAALAESSLANRGLATELYRDIAARSADGEARRRARAALARLDQGR